MLWPGPGKGVGGGGHSSQHRGFGWRWVAEIPTEVWFMIAGQLGRLGWPNDGRDALPLQLPRRA